jgi:uncharacterized protein with HEPN domain
MRDDESRIADIVGAIRRIQVYVADLDLTSFIANNMASDAVVRQIEIIGEAAAQISDDYKKAHPEIPWRKMTGMRNVLIHQYEEVDLRQVWTVATIDAPGLLRTLEKQ